VRVDRPAQEWESAFYGGSWGSLGVWKPLHELTTNQKAAGSSPAERAREIAGLQQKCSPAPFFVLPSPA
jgi:hypothetical protein